MEPLLTVFTPQIITFIMIGTLLAALTFASVAYLATKRTTSKAPVEGFQTKTRTLFSEMVVSWKAHRGRGRHLGKLVKVEKSGRRGIVERTDGYRFRRSMASLKVHGTL